MIDKNALGSLRDELRREEQILVIVRKNPTLDAMAGGLALYLTLSKAGKKVSILCPTEPIVELSNLVGINKVSTKQVSSGKDLTIVLPYQKGRIDKISYNIEGDSIHLDVKAGSEGLGFDENQITFLKTGGALSGLLFLVDVSTIDDVSDILSQKDFEGKRTVNISKFESQIVAGDSLSFVDPEASSVSELVAKIIADIGATLDIDSAQNLMLGISAATNNFQSANVSPLAFEMAGFLMRYGVARNIEKKENIREDKIDLKEDKKEEKKEEPPLDWLTPKIYKGSTLP